MKWVCNRRGHHNWLMGGPRSVYVPTPDICLTCGAQMEWAPAPELEQSEEYQLALSLIPAIPMIAS
jgi:hypothetical protein